MLTPDNFLVRVSIITRGIYEFSDARASRACVARFDASRLQAVERASQLKRELFLADALFPCEQQRAGHTSAREHSPQSLLSAIVADETGEHKNLGVGSQESGVGMKTVNNSSYSVS
jgi:hypothetical protein